jgi:hypothetical protein
LGSAGISFFQNRYFPTWIFHCIKQVRERAFRGMKVRDPEALEP